MTSFVRLFGGALGVLIAIALASGAGIPPLDIGSLSGIILLAGWIGAWFVIGFSILPYVTFVPARGLIRRVLDLSTGEFVSAVAGLLVGLLIGLLLGCRWPTCPNHTAGLCLSARSSSRAWA